MQIIFVSIKILIFTNFFINNRFIKKNNPDEISLPELPKLFHQTIRKK